MGEGQFFKAIGITPQIISDIGRAKELVILRLKMPEKMGHLGNNPGL